LRPYSRSEPVRSSRLQRCLATAFETSRAARVRPIKPLDISSGPTVFSCGWSKLMRRRKRRSSCAIPPLIVDAHVDSFRGADDPVKSAKDRSSGNQKNPAPAVNGSRGHLAAVSGVAVPRRPAQCVAPRRKGKSRSPGPACIGEQEAALERHFSDQGAGRLGIPLPRPVLSFISIAGHFTSQSTQQCSRTDHGAGDRGCHFEFDPTAKSRKGFPQLSFPARRQE